MLEFFFLEAAVGAEAASSEIVYETKIEKATLEIALAIESGLPLRKTRLTVDVPSEVPGRSRPRKDRV